MLTSPETLRRVIPSFFRKILVGLPPSDAAILDVVDSSWKAGRIPDLRAMIDTVAEGDPDQVIPDLLMIDMEWRWKSGRPEVFRDLRDYEALLQHPLSLRARAKVLCREFGIRNHWGDCISRQQICGRHPELTELFLKLVEKEIQDIAEWPQFSLLQHGKPIASKPLDRPITAGRQASSTQTPWSMHSSDFCHHLVLCEMQNPILSREQLELRLCPGRIVSIRNTSKSRAIAIRSNRVVIDAGQSYQCSVERPVRIHLTGEYDILIAH